MSVLPSSAIEEIDHRGLAEADVVALNEYENALKAEAYPDDPPMPVERTRALVHNLAAHVFVREFWIRTNDGRIAAAGYAHWYTTEDNRHIATIDVSVRPEERRRHLASRLLADVVAVARDDGRTMLLWHSNDRVPAGEAFSLRIGGEIAQRVHKNRLLISDVDHALVRRWIDEGPARAPGYSLVLVDGPFPEDIVENAVASYHVMNTAPRDDLAWEDRNLTVEQMREIERAGVAQGSTRLVVFAREDSSGRFVGLSEIFWNPADPKTIDQGDTAVHPEHRGHGLGKWMKASMLDRIMSRWPEVEDVRTGNADSNDAMLGINHALGFKPFVAGINWQAPTERVEQYVARRSH